MNVVVYTSDPALVDAEHEIQEALEAAGYFVASVEVRT